MKLGEDFQKVDIKDKELYLYYKKTVKNPVPYKKFKEVLNTYNKKAVKLIVDGGSFYFGEGLSFLKVIEKKLPQGLDSEGLPKRRINWPETFKLNKRDNQGRLLKVYILDDNPGYEIKWFTQLVLNSPIRHWKFAPCKGFRLKIRQAFEDNPFQGNKYKSIKRHSYDI